MRHLQILAALSLFAFIPAVTPAATTPTWKLANALSVTASANSNSTFVIHAYVTLPLACYDARVRTALTSSGRVYFVEQMAPPPTMTCAPNYKCSVVSASIPLPSPQTIHVTSQGQTWKVHMVTHDQTPVQPVCHKAS